MKKLLACVLLVSLLLMLCSCTGYRAIGLVRIETSHGFETSFLSLDGQLQFKVKKTDRGTEGEISYSVQVDEGELRLYYETNGVKQELVTVKAGESVTDKGGYVEGGRTVYVIIEANNARGKVSVELDNE